MTSASYSIGISGAGIGGLALAILLKKSGHNPEIFERFDTAKPVGSGLVIQPVGQTVLNEIGVGKSVTSMGTKLTRMYGTTDTGKTVLDVLYDRSGAQTTYGLAIQRHSLFSALYNAAQNLGIPIHTDCEVKGTSDQSFVLMDGRQTPSFDLLVDSSGAKSTLSPLSQKQLPFGAIWATVKWAETTGLPDTQLTQRYQAARHMIGVMPSGRQSKEDPLSATLFWSLPANGYDDWRANGLDRWKQKACDLWPEISKFVEQIESIDDFTMAQYSHGTLRKPWKDRLVFIGDAAHRASPQLGQGANMALLDAWSLTQALNNVGPDEAGARYAAIRRWHVRMYQLASWAFTPMYQSHSHLLPFLRDQIFYPVSCIPPLPRMLTGLVCGTLLNPFKVR